jgi:hypothetical protein
VEPHEAVEVGAIEADVRCISDVATPNRHDLTMRRLMTGKTES